MKKFVTIFLVQLIVLFAKAEEFYLKGEVTDEKGTLLPNVKLKLHSTGLIYYSGQQGSFGIVSKKENDSISFIMDGFFTKTETVKAGNYIKVVLEISPDNQSFRRNKLASFTKNLGRDDQRKWFAGNETYASTVENQFINAEKFPSTGFALNVDKASYSNIRRFITMNAAVPPDAVRVEEMLNYFNSGFDAPEGNDVFKINSVLTDCPWNTANRLLYLKVSSKKLNIDSLPPAHLTFLIDVSGSMDMPNRLPMLKAAFRMLVNNLREKDTVSIVVYGGVAGVMLQPTGGIEKEKINKVIDELEAGGNTPGESGLRMAYMLAVNHFIKGGNNRIILATDGDFNVGAQSEKDLDELISVHRQTGIHLTCLGVGMGNYKDSKIQTLARKGNGNFAYLDNDHEAEKVLLKEFTQNLYTIAEDVYMNVDFNPDYVKSYRLIGFDNKVGSIVDTTAVIEGGEIGSGHSMIAAFEIELARTPDTLFAKKPLAKAGIMYKKPNASPHLNYDKSIPFQYTALENIAPFYRFATAVIMYGCTLKESNFCSNIGFNDVLFIAGKAVNNEDITQLQFLDLVQRTKDLYASFKKRKKRKGSEEL